VAYLPVLAETAAEVTAAEKYGTGTPAAHKRSFFSEMGESAAYLSFEQ
jgi:hypothetical protein